MTQGILNVCKPVGMTSFQVISHLRKVTGIKKIGHCGTLDPFAEGVLPICLGRATAAVRFMDGYDKRYRARLCLGIQTDTGDCDGHPIRIEEITEEQVRRWTEGEFSWRRTLKTFEGVQEQEPPMYSAVKIGGRKLYELARMGRKIERPTRSIEVYEARALRDPYYEQDFCCLEAEFFVSKGTYIRTLGEELAQRMGTVGHLRRLLRESCGPFTLKNSIALEKLESGEVDWREVLLPTDFALGNLPTAQLPLDAALRLVQGQKISSDELGWGDRSFLGKVYRVYFEKLFLGLACWKWSTAEKKVQLCAERMFVSVDPHTRQFSED